MKVLTGVVLILVLVVSVGCRRQAAPPPVMTAAGAATSADQSAPPMPVQPAIPATVDAVAEIPAYPGATQIERKQAVNKDGFARLDEVKLHSAAPLTSIKVFYANAITAAGWQVTASEDKPDEAKWKLIKGTAVAEIKLDARSAGGVDIMIERKDR